jgi:2-aminoadipate transaminase
VIKDGFLREHVPTIRSLYKTQRDAMQSALQTHMPPGCRWNTPVGGMFFWLELPRGVDATALLPQAVAAGMAFVPGAPFFLEPGHENTVRLSFVTVPPAKITEGVAIFARVLKEALQ